MTNDKFQKRKSFTLVEVLVAVAILMLMIGATIGVEVASIKVADTGKRQLQATGLARGALNLVRTIRDTNILNSRSAFKSIDITAPDVIKYLNEDTENHTWSLSDDINSTYKVQTLDGTEYTIEVTVE